MKGEDRQRKQELFRVPPREKRTTANQHPTPSESLKKRNPDETPTLTIQSRQQTNELEIFEPRNN